MYFSREPIPSKQKAPNANYRRFKQLGIVAFRAGFLQTFARLAQTPLETLESVDMMRALEHGYTIRMVGCDQEVVGVDRPADLDRAAALLKNDPLVWRYQR
jgi:3-deoxy-manno-octulosonate cytidylyltransferase (CMP-KDO synthetase)